MNFDDEFLESLAFDEDFLESLPDDIPAAIVAICKEYFEPKNLFGILSKFEYTKEALAKHDHIKGALALIAAYSEVNNLGIDVPIVVNELEKDKNNADKLFNKLLKDYSQEINKTKFDRYKNIFIEKIGKAFPFEFSEGDLELIQKLIEELRDLISKTEELQEEHRQRLLRKLEKVQSELHKKVSDLDRFWGFCIDLSIVVGMMGKNAEPAADLVKKIVDIILPAQNRAYELPSSLPFKLLGQADDKSKDDKSKGKE